MWSYGRKERFYVSHNSVEKQTLESWRTSLNKGKKKKVCSWFFQSCKIQGKKSGWIISLTYNLRLMGSSWVMITVKRWHQMKWRHLKVLKLTPQNGGICKFYWSLWKLMIKCSNSTVANVFLSYSPCWNLHVN